VPPPSLDRFLHERATFATGITRLAGVDEAGRGPLAGPVAAAAVILPRAWVEHGMPADWAALNDSKQLSEGRREEFYGLITGHPEIEFGIALVDSRVIDALNILQATHQVMNDALRQLRPRPEHALVDGTLVKSLLVPQTPLVKGDSLSYSIAAASVLAKVARDRLMIKADELWPEYGFAQHKGYPTPEHLAALAKHGPCPIHRRSFAPLRKPEPELFPK
jgi:ribonuclease HII